MNSISCNRILANNSNLAREALIAATAQRPSTDIRLISSARAGGGRIVAQGSYTGAADTDIEIEVLTGTGGELTASTPIIDGVGSGALTITAIAPSAQPETLTFSLLDAGSPPEPAELEFYGVTLVAVTPGAGGNALSLSVVRNLTATPMPYATLERIAAGTDTLDGAEWDWGQPPATAAGIPAGALRIQFDGFPQIHRAWKVWDGGRFKYRIDPAVGWDIPADTRILAVTGDYTLTLTDGTSPEVYTAVTLYDFLSAVEARSALAQVRGVVVRDTAPGGMAVTDIPLRTDAHALPAKMSVRSPHARQLTDITVSPSAPTENITITRLPRTVGAGNDWSVRGGVSGDLPNATTGALYTAGPVQFRIPPIPAPPGGGADTGARISATVHLTSRSEGEFDPALCFKPLLLGAAASDKSITFTYKRRPPADCLCNNMAPLAVSLRCLGLGDDDMSNYDPDYLDRVKSVYAWRESYVRGNTAVDGPVPQVSYFTVRIALDMGAVMNYGNYTTAGAAAAEESTWGAGVTITSGIGLPGQTITFSNGKTLVLESVTGQITGQDLAGTPVTTDGVVEVIVTPGRDSTVFVAAGGDLDWMHQATSILLSALGDVWQVSDARDEWDGLWAEVQADLAALLTTSGSDLDPESTDRYMDRYRAAVDNIYLAAGIVPKSDASPGGGDQCWRDYPDETHWWVDESGEYLPAFTNKPYVSAARDADGRPRSTREFGFGIVTECEHRLKPGDRITITIRGTSGTDRDFGDGDTYTIPVIAAQATPFTDGADGDPTHTWTVRGSVSGALPDWAWHPTTPAPYSAGPIDATLTAGGIPWEVGDSIRVALEGGTLRWRRDGGAWAESPIFGGAIAVGDGLQLVAHAGVAPSFVAGDQWHYRAMATHGISRLRQPRIGSAFAWDGDAVQIDVDLGTAQPLECVLLGLHTLPAGAVITITGGLAAPDQFTTAPTHRPSAILAPLPAGTVVRHLRITIAGAGAGASIGWLYAGTGWQPTVGASDLDIRRTYGLMRGGGLNPAALYRGRGEGGRWRWSIDDGGVLLDAALDALLALLDHVAAQGLEPVALVPDIRRPERTHLAILDTDEVPLTESMHWQTGTRAVSVELPFRAVLS